MTEQYAEALYTVVCPDCGEKRQEFRWAGEDPRCRTCRAESALEHAQGRVGALATRVGFLESENAKLRKDAPR